MSRVYADAVLPEILESEENKIVRQVIGSLLEAPASLADHHSQ